MIRLNSTYQKLLVKISLLIFDGLTIHLWLAGLFQISSFVTRSAEPIDNVVVLLKSPHPPFGIGEGEAPTPSTFTLKIASSLQMPNSIPVMCD